MCSYVVMLSVYICTEPPIITVILVITSMEVVRVAKRNIATAACLQLLRTLRSAVIAHVVLAARRKLFAIMKI